MGVLAALHHRARTGEGQIVDSALYESVLQVMESMVAEYAVAGVVREVLVDDASPVEYGQVLYRVDPNG